MCRKTIRSVLPLFCVFCSSFKDKPFDFFCFRCFQLHAQNLKIMFFLSNKFHKLLEKKQKKQFR